jgi:RNA polymerase sigma-70 factor, ECF subfamily
VTYASGSANCGVLTRPQASGSRSRRSEVLEMNPRTGAYGPAGRPSSTSAIARSDDREWQAVQEIFLASRPKFVRMAYGILRNREDAEDAVQDALLSAYVHLRAFEARSALMTWFGRIVLNASFMIRRKRKSSRIESLPESSHTFDGTWIEGIPASEPDPEMYSAERETLALIDGLLDKMSPMLRQAFTMTHFKQMSTAEACALLGVSAGTFKSRLLRARRHLTNQLQRSLVAPIRRLTHSTLFRSRTNSLTRAAEPGELPPAFSAMTRRASDSGTLHAND